MEQHNPLGAMYTPYHNEKAVACMLGLSIYTLQKYRRQGKGPKYYKFGRSVRYSTRHILDYMQTNEYRNTSEYKGGSDD